jgi:hypothetical protein
MPSVNNCIRHDGLYRPSRLFRNYAQQSAFPRRLYLPPLGLSRLDGLARIYCIQTTNFQSGRKDQSPMVKVVGYRRPFENSRCRKHLFIKQSNPPYANMYSYDAAVTLRLISKHRPRLSATLDPICQDVNPITFVRNVKSSKSGTFAVSRSYPPIWVS